MVEEPVMSGLTNPAAEAPVVGRFAEAYSAYVSALQAADADAWKRAHDLYCEYQKGLWELAREPSAERAAEAYEAYQGGLVEAWKERSSHFEAAYASYLESVGDAFSSAELPSVDPGALSSIGYSLMLAAQGAAVARGHAAATSE